MSELREFECRIYWPVEQGVDEVNDIDLFYLKSEADKVIAELKDDCAYWKMSEGNAVNAMHETEEYAMQLYNELRHQKFKRCLAMAKWCHNESLWWYSKGYGFEKYDKFWEKWEKRWLEIADKFKEAK